VVKFPMMRRALNRPEFPRLKPSKISITLPIDQRDAVLDRLDDVRSISHNFGYGVGDEMDILLSEYKSDA
jgi:hypothetical protein